MDMDLSKIMQLMANNGNNKDMSLIMQLLPALMNNNRPAPPREPVKLNEEEVNKTLKSLYEEDER